MNSRAIAAAILNSYRHTYHNYEQKIAAQTTRNRLSQKDRDFVYLLVKGVIIYRRYLDYALAAVLNRDIGDLQGIALNLLRIGAFQKYMLATPDHAVVNETVRAAKALKQYQIVAFLNATLRHLPDGRILEKELAKLPTVESLATAGSHPDWLVQAWIDAFGADNTRRLIAFNNSYSEINFRHNPVKIAEDRLLTDLEREKYRLKVIASQPQLFFTVSEPGKLLKSSFFQKGYLSVQDYSQSLAVPLLTPREGTVILDVCAAPGGKSTYIAQLCKGSAVLYGYDISEKKLVLLKNEACRLGIDFINYGVADARRAAYPQADRILLDVPCSGTGVLARRADLRWNRTPDELDKLVGMQHRILQNCWYYLKPGGILVYSTCSLERRENWDLIRKFLNSRADAEIEPASRFVAEEYCGANGAMQILPFQHKMTGSYAVRLKKQETE